MAKVTIKNVRDSQVPMILDKLKGIDNAAFIISYREASQVIEDRLKFIMKLINEFHSKGRKHSLETYFRLSRRRGYSMNRKTFTRDIALLEDMGKINREVTVGGANGRTSIITKASP